MTDVPGPTTPGTSMLDAAPKPPKNAVAERAHPLTPVIRTWIMLVAAGFWAAQEAATGNLHDLWSWGFGLWIFGSIALLQIVLGVFSWRFTRFVADEVEFRIERTFIWHRSEVISYRKIQSVDIQQPFAARLFGLARLHVDVGGGSGTTIEYLTRHRAEHLRDHLLRMARPSIADGAADTSSAGPQHSREADPLHQALETVVVAVTPANLVAAAVTSTSFVVTLAITAVLGIGLEWGLMIPLLIPLAGIITSQVIRQWNYRLIRTGDALRTSRGLTTLSSQTVPRHRIQGIRVTQPLLTRPFGLWRMQVTVLGYGLADDADVSSVVMPAGPWQDIETALDAIWPGFAMHELPWQGQPTAARWLTWFTWRTRGWAYGRLVFATRRGLLTRKIDLVPYARMQGIELSEGPIQRRLGLASVTAHVSPGAVAAVAGHATTSDARALADRLVESGRQSRAGDLELHALLARPAPPPAYPPQPGYTSETVCPIVEP